VQNGYTHPFHGRFNPAWGLEVGLRGGGKGRHSLVGKRMLGFKIAY
jgi:hypothetical protein